MRQLLVDGQEPRFARMDGLSICSDGLDHEDQAPIGMATRRVRAPDDVYQLPTPPHFHHHDEPGHTHLWTTSSWHHVVRSPRVRTHTT
jgi:hypothetical protein